METVGDWFKSSFSDEKHGDNVECLEMRHLSDGGCQLRHSKHPDGPRIVLTAAEKLAFIRGARAGEFDSPSGA